jgi:hypothetical protein
MYSSIFLFCVLELGVGNAAATRRARKATAAMPTLVAAAASRASPAFSATNACLSTMASPRRAAGTAPVILREQWSLTVTLPQERALAAAVSEAVLVTLVSLASGACSLVQAVRSAHVIPLAR